MFRIKEIILHSEDKNKKYKFSNNTFVYGNNTVGKTALTKVIDFVLGSSQDLKYDGLDNIDEIEAYLINDKTELWIKRGVNDNSFKYKRTKNSKYSIISFETYKSNIGSIINEKINEQKIRIYSKVFNEKPSFRSFSILNYIDEKGQGNLKSIFTRGTEQKHIFRINDIMSFLFNYKNIEKIYDKATELEKCEKEYNKYKEAIQLLSYSLSQIKKIFNELDLEYFEGNNEIKKNKETFDKYKLNFNRTKLTKQKDIIYLMKISSSLSEDIKLFEYMKEQSDFSDTRKERNDHFLVTLKSIVLDNPQYKEEIKNIENIIEEIQKDKLILSVVDYDTSINEIKKEKEKVDCEIIKLKNKSSKLDFEETLKKIGQLENLFDNVLVSKEVNLDKLTSIGEYIKNLKNDIKDLIRTRDKEIIKEFNHKLTKMYINSKIGDDVPYLYEDRNNNKNFHLIFDPYTQSLSAEHNEDNIMVSYMPGSMARHIHFQILVYLCVLEYLSEYFSDFIYLPLLVVDSADQATNKDAFEKIYPSIIDFANNIGIQTIFMSKTKYTCVNDKDIIDISDGLNPFHKNQ